MTTFAAAPLTPETWADFEKVMGSNGGSRNCWCMHWRLPFAQWDAGRDGGNKRAMRARAAQQPPPGLVCYVDGEPAGWVGIGERSEYSRLQRSPVTKAVDDTPVWVITCLFVRHGHRRHGLQADMIEAACAFAAENGVQAVEGFPVEPAPGRKAGPDTAMTGIASAFLAAGFTEVDRRKEDRPAMRRDVRG
ncbi:GNAT family N-acetyltransferase [Pseudonocardia xinjiangensis]|uniref:GNAT family N-acetyltransferase n=1 Tax=Pseudonocardia xinjiangensis TaxID=75289 RepID=UPI003D935CBC